MKKNKKYIFKKSNGLKMISSTLVLASLLSSCAEVNNDLDMSTTMYSGTTSNTEASTTTTEVTTQPTEESTTQTTEHSIETIEYTSPIQYDINLSKNFKAYLVNKYGNRVLDDVTNFGFDNHFLNDSLHEYLSQNYSINDSNITIHDFHYFQFLNYWFGGCAYDDMNEVMEAFKHYKCNSCLARAVLVEQNLQFFVDEIPSSYFEERFPEFMENYENPEIRNQWQERLKYIVTNELDRNNYTLEDINNLNDYDYDLFLFNCLIKYNFLRNSLMYFPASNTALYDIKQIRDESTGRNFLQLTDAHVRRIENVMDNYEGYDFSITEPESREHFYQTYGFYPEDVVNENKVYEGNRSSGTRSR